MYTFIIYNIHVYIYIANHTSKMTLTGKCTLCIFKHPIGETHKTGLPSALLLCTCECLPAAGTAISLRDPRVELQE